MKNSHSPSVSTEALHADTRAYNRKDNAGTIVYDTTKYTYDPVGNRTAVETPRGVATVAAGDFVAQTTYDALNRVKDQLTPFDPADPPVQHGGSHDADL